MLFIDDCKVLRGGRLVDSTILIDQGRIAAIDKPMPYGADRVSAEGHLVMPGAIDVHVHLRTPGAEHKEDVKTGSMAAAKGGVTTIFDMPNTKPATTTVEFLEQKRSLFNGKSYVNYAFYLGATPENADEIRRAQNIAGVKVYMGSSTGDLLVANDDALFKTFEAARDAGVPVVAHAENEDLINLLSHRAKQSGRSDSAVHSEIRPPVAAAEAASRAAIISKHVGNRLHLTHVSTRQELHVVRLALGRVTCDVTPHHLFLDDSAYPELGNFGRMNPPLRNAADRESILKSIDIVTCVATDHAPHTREEKEKPYWEAPSGVPGLETMLPLLLDAASKGRISLPEVQRLTSEGPARAWGLANKGRVEEGADADLVIVDLNAENVVSNSELVTKAGWSPFAGRVLKGWPVATLVSGEFVFNAGLFGAPTGKEIQFKQALQAVA
jgi:dihydroorotase